jgi:hypothetical protein
VANEKTPKQQLLEFVQTSYEQEFDELVDNWKGIETKAQGTVAVCGIFIAAVIAFATKHTGDFVTLRAVFLSLALFLLIASVVCAVAALLVTSVPNSPRGEDVEDKFKPLLAKDVLEQSDLSKLGGEIIDKWRSTNVAIHEANGKKADRLFVAQALLLAAIFVAVVIGDFEVWRT